MKLLLSLILLVLIFGQWSCRKPTDGVIVSMDMSAVTGSSKYHILVQVRDAAALNKTPAGASVDVGGQDAAYIMNSSGSKSLTVQSGIIDIAIDPKRAPQSNQPVSFDLSINAPGYLPQVRNIQVAFAEYDQEVYVDLINIKTPPPGMQLTEANLSLSNGAVAALTKINAENGTLKTIATSALPASKKVNGMGPSVNADDLKPADVPLNVEDGFVTVVFPKGSTFYYRVPDTGLVKYTRSVPKYDTIVHTINTSNPNSSGNFVEMRLKGYYDEEAFGPRFKKVAYSGAVKIITYSQMSNASEGLKVFPFAADGAVDYGKSIRLLKNRRAPENKMLFDGITVKSGRPATENFSNKVLFYGVDEKNKLFSISPDSTYDWFISYTLDADKINPLTNKKIVAGDSVETGINSKADSTYRSVIRSVKIGTQNYLRTESQTANVGFYYEAPYTQSYNLTINSTVPQAIRSIPDQENLAFQSYLNMGQYSLYLPFYLGNYTDNKPLAYSGTLVSSTPITPPSVHTYVSYWWKLLVNTTQTTTFNAQIDLFANANIRLEPRVDFEMCIKCSEKNLIITPSQWGYVIIPGDDSPYRRTQRSINLVNGKWSTMGLPIGGDYTATGTFLGKSPKYKLKIDGPIVRDTAFVNCGSIGF